MQPANCVSLLLLLAVLLLATLGPFAAAAHRSELAMAAAGDKLGARMEKTTEAAAKGSSEESATTRRSLLAVRFRTRKVPSDPKNRLDGRVAFTADYHAVQRHPSKHN